MGGSPVRRDTACKFTSSGGSRPFCVNQLLLFLRLTTLWQDFTATEQVGHRVAADGIGLPRGHDGLNLLRGQTLRAEIGVQLDEDLFIRYVVGRFLCRVPPERPPQDLRDGRADVDGDVAQDAVLATLPEFDGLRGFADFLLPFEETGTEDGEKTFIAIHRSLKGGKSLPGEFKEAGGGSRSFRYPGGAAPDTERG